MTETAVFGGGCFWCTEAVFKRLKGVTAVESGYTGGTVANPTYEQVCGGQTGHAEVIRIEYDPELVSYETLLTIFFASHDATELDRQGADIGTQYRSAIFTISAQQAEAARAFIAKLDASSEDGDPIVTVVEPLGAYYPAEEYHQDYYARNAQAGYCRVVIAPKLQKVQKEYADLLAGT